MESCRSNNHPQLTLKAWYDQDFQSHRFYRSVHVAGTNGKGSVIQWLEALLATRSLTTGSFISPHLISHNERIRLDGIPISLDEWEQTYDALHPLFSRRQMTMFEMDLWMAASIFKTRRPDWVLMETGLGGSKDATNILNYPFGIITRIGMDHMAYLGPTKEEIAKAKAGIIHEDMFIITAETDPECLRIFANTCQKQHAWLIQIPDPETYDFSGFWPSGLPEYQKENFLCALTTLEMAGMSFSTSQLKKAADHFFWPGRFQLLQRDPAILLDGAHNPDGINALVSTLLKDGNEKIKPQTIYFSVLADKQADEMIERLSDLNAELILVHFDTYRLADLEVLAQKYNCDILSFEDLFVRLARTKRPALICGSLYFAGAVLAKWQQEHPDFQIDKSFGFASRK
ncbi:folylpolyglutamate synthase/dihydrofolate synthase [Erysipelotrichaceae bacterium RD49]|nr:folylpolyglutamate synthase/dihydrofolate synthase [Erysipelotrichaceae bacterium RD49]